jgi:agmatine deiminase
MPCRQPAEWQKHRAVWSAWPSHADLWEDDLVTARQQVAALFRAIADDGRGEQLEILVHGDEALASAQAALAGVAVRFHAIPFGDIWLRDTAPIFVETEAGVEAASFRFNGWGAKYQLPYDADVSASVARASGLRWKAHDWVLEGGSIEVDGAGLGLTTEQCLLNPNRRSQISQNLSDHLGVERILWLGDGLANDHTDGHIDNLARIVAPNVVAVPETRQSDDPNRDVFADALARLKREKGIDIVTIPSAGRVEDEDGDVIPASFMNFYIANSTVIVPVYGTPQDDAAVAAVGALFPERKVIGLAADAILTGGGSFHCITQQEPLL